MRLIRTVCLMIFGSCLYLLFFPLSIFNGTLKREFKIFLHIQKLILLSRNFPFSHFYLSLVVFIMSEKNGF
jgi:hypothetical protein